jgi:hypothetical protein
MTAWWIFLYKLMKNQTRLTTVSFLYKTMTFILVFTLIFVMKLIKWTKNNVNFEMFMTGNLEFVQQCRFLRYSSMNLLKILTFSLSGFEKRQQDTFRKPNYTSFFLISRLAFKTGFVTFLARLNCLKSVK